MSLEYRRKTVIVVMSLALLLTVSAGATLASDPDELVTYRITIKNLNRGQPLSPPVAATHQEMQMFQVGGMASEGLEALAEDGNQGVIFDLFNGSEDVTEAINVGVPLTPYGQVVGDFEDSVSFEISAHPGDRLSLATMLICTNDGFVGLDRVRLPRGKFAFYVLKGYDAGTEENTEMSQDIVDACSALGPVTLAGDPNGNEDAAVDTDPQEMIALHEGIQGVGDLSILRHGWFNPSGAVIIRRID
jgi:hypothetical protein